MSMLCNVNHVLENHENFVTYKKYEFCGTKIQLKTLVFNFASKLMYNKSYIIKYINAGSIIF